ncbi:MAG: hypothetical protein CYPHOPRED_000007 [Cyphobasidiales sp. Tagirdzhanova-0007]|nr:MAG: hypothetical protein CYPHOPRED_000007 [Cyphobasidiales sp. Tagirdzhanova-0007]
MPFRNTILAAGLVLLAQTAALAVVSPRALTPPLPIDTTSGDLLSFVLPDNATCPVNSNDGVNVQALAVVQIQELAKVTVGQLLAGQVDLNISVCLCITVDVNSNLIDVPANVTLEAEATLSNAITTDAFRPAFLNEVNLLGIDVNVTASPTSTSSSQCTCSVNEVPTCSDGRCGCQQVGQAGPSVKRRAYAGPASTAIAGRQAKREDIVRRMAAKAGSRALPAPIFA